MANLDIIRGRQVIAALTNESGGPVALGDVVILDPSNDESFTTTTTPDSTAHIGIAQEAIAAGATGRVLLAGYAPLVNVSTSAARGDFLYTHSVAKQAAPSSQYRSGAFGRVVKAGGSPSAFIFSLVTQLRTGTLNLTIDGGGVAISAGVKLDLVLDFDGEFLGYDLLADQTGSIVCDVWRDIYANFPPTAADSICGGNKPTLSAAQKAQDMTLTGWTKAFSAGDVLRLNVDSAATITRATLALKYRRTG